VPTGGPQIFEAEYTWTGKEQNFKEDNFIDSNFGKFREKWYPSYYSYEDNLILLKEAPTILTCDQAKFKQPS